jgi:hypothetical protein
MTTATKAPRHHRTKLQMQAAAKLALTIKQLGSKISPADAAFEPLNFADWMMTCDTRDAAWVLLLIQTLESALIHIEFNPKIIHEGIYLTIRKHYLDYANAAFQRRWPDHPALQLVDSGDEIPF